MKFSNYFVHVFAVVGVISLIFWSCSVADSDSIENPIQLTGGTYQVELISFGSGGTEEIVVLNTETGVMKTYTKNVQSDYDWTESQSTPMITFTH